MSATVATVTAIQSNAITRAKKIRDLIGGTTAMRSAGPLYLPKYPAEESDAYAARLRRSVLFNAVGKTVDDMTGRVFRDAIKLGDDVHAKIVPLVEDIDFTGRHLNVFARDAFRDAMQTGIGFILTDMPPAIQNEDGRPVTIAQEQASGHRPYMVFIPLERVIGWKSERINNVETLTQFRVTETVIEPDGDFNEKEVEQVRLIERGHWTTWRKNDKADNWIVHQSGTISISDIPIVPVYLNRTAFMQGTPPLDALADISIAHWQSASDQRNLLTLARVPILVASGFTADDRIQIGAAHAIQTTNSDAKLAYVEHSGAAIGAGRDDLKDLEFQMQQMGLQLLVPQPGAKTATGELHDHSKEVSQLAMMANALQDAIEQALGYMAEFMGLPREAGGSVIVNTDFGVMPTADVDTLISAVRAELISRETFWLECQRRGVLSDSFDYQVEKDRLAMLPPELDAGSGKGMDL